MNVAVVGLGSMGKRRIRLIREMNPEYRIIGIDNREDRRAEVAELFGISCMESPALADVECLFVCTSPLSHDSIIHDALSRKCHVFTELNLVTDGYDENIKLAKENEVVLFLSSPFLYRAETRYIRSKVTGEKWNYIYHIGQYLPDWHPWEKYQNSFLGSKRTSGCREILAIELPWLTATFGEVEEFHVIADKMTELDIEYRDNFMIQFSHANDNKGVLVVDVVSPVAVRKLEVYKEDRYMTWSGIPESLMEFQEATKSLESVILSEKTERLAGYRAFVTENVYRTEIVEFFESVRTGKRPEYGFEEDLKILKLIDSIGV